jgi:hypothetical protein
MAQAAHEARQQGKGLKYVHDLKVDPVLEICLWRPWRPFHPAILLMPSSLYEIPGRPPAWDNRHH